MKKWKKYPFFLMIIISSVLYGGGQLLGIGSKAETEMVSVSQPAKEMPIGEKRKETKAVKKQESEKVNPNQGEAGTESQSQIISQADQTGQQPGQMEVVQQSETAEEQVTPQTREFQRVEMDYLDDALFIGDSRTSTLYEYAGWENTDFFVKYGQSVWDVFDNDMDGVTLEQMLTGKQYGKIYIMLGVNELGTGTAESFAAQFENDVERIRQLQPNAIIFIESIMHVTQSKDEEHSYINNQEINTRNDKLKELADGQTIFYIDENEAMDEPGTGALNGEYSFDGVHIQAKYIEVWREFLLDHGIK